MANKIVADRYELLKEVGRGGMSRVFLATDLGLNKNWAVKEILKSGLLAGQEVQNSLLAEAEMMKNLDHPALPRIVDIVEDERYYYIVMDFVEGENLKDIVDKTGIQSQEQVISWGLELGSVLQYLHSQDPPIIYRDMKPANIILQPNGSLKLIDFGIARTYKAEKIEDTMPLGTKGYAAPEQFIKSEQTDARTDIYSLGVTLYELLTCHVPSKPPYHLIPARQLNPGLSVGIEKVIQRCTNPDPDKRFQSAEEFMLGLMNFEKYDEAYIHSQKKKLLKAVIPFMIGVILLISGVTLSIVNHVMLSNSYQALLKETGNSQTRIENLKKAIELDPKELDAYQLLVKEYAESGLTEKGSEQILTICNNGMSHLNPKSEEYLDINYMLGESYLVYYTGATDNSLRNKVLTASPFFDTVIANADEDYEFYKMANAYSILADFYEEYILSADTTFVFDADQNDYKTLLKEFQNMLELLSTSENEENNQLKVVTYSIMLSILDSERNNMVRAISQEEFFNIIEKIETAARQGISTSNASLAKQKDDVLEQCKNLKKDVQETYRSGQKKEETVKLDEESTEDTENTGIEASSQ